MTDPTTTITTHLDALCACLRDLPLAEQVTHLNTIRQRLHEDVSPFHQEPVDCVVWVPGTQVQPNDYNPNHVAPPEMRLLERSVTHDGFTQPVVGGQVVDTGLTAVVDGEHRSRIGKERRLLRERVHGYLPVVYIKARQPDPTTNRRSQMVTRNELMAATIRHNRARGVHAVRPMIEIVAEMVRNNWSATQIAQELGMDADEVLRLLQQTGMAELFRDQSFSKAWE